MKSCFEGLYLEKYLCIFGENNHATMLVFSTIRSVINLSTAITKCCEEECQKSKTIHRAFPLKSSVVQYFVNRGRYLTEDKKVILFFFCQKKKKKNTFREKLEDDLMFWNPFEE